MGTGKADVPREEALKKKYWRKFGGPAFREVLVGGHGSNSEYRRIDAVHVLKMKKGAKRFRVNLKDQQKFAQLVSGLPVKVIEAKRKLNRSVIGQAIVAKHMFKMAYGQARKITPVVICEEGDDYLERVCKRLGVEVEALGR